MAYIFTKTERNNFKASTFETKSLLYLAAQGNKYKDITVLSIDCFNDVSGMCNNENIWDIQAKGEKNLTPRKIGNYLITLYENFISEFNPFFKEFIFFMPQLNERYINNAGLTSYGIENFKDSDKEKVLEGLRISAKLNKSVELKLFFEKVLFVEDRTVEQSYIKGIMKFKSSKLNDDNFYSAIFKEIRDRQTALKNSEIENLQIDRPNDVLNLNRYLTSEDLQLFVLNRLVGGDVFSNKRKLPSSYAIFTRNIDEDHLEDHIFEQNAALSRVFFDKNNKNAFWRLFAAIFKSLSKDPMKKVTNVIGELDQRLIDRTEHLDIDSTRFLVAIIRDGLINEN
ncbi:hypothetical protein G3479_19290 [Shewanella baltica]|uniref:hypothetical protein n=1 Tax=Shewanella baltica TaxID=62322 RepID=UPI00217CCA00|nr:hypothetical protein [Shewanella baltica]MCS6261350.1 hypothetical protein [Shewanella baltica]